jgi:ADP-heptose:LPS heptosyltransferase
MKLPLHEIKKIAVFRALHLGDLLCVVPALRALRYTLPEAEIALIGLPWSAAFVKRFHKYVDRVIIFPGYPGLPEQIPSEIALVNFLEEMQKEGFDLVLQMQGNGTIVNMLVQMFGAKYTAGFYQTTDPGLPSGFFIKYPENLLEVKRYLKLIEFLGIPDQGLSLEFPIIEQDQKDLDSLRLGLPDKQFVIVHPGSRSFRRRWHPKYFAALADHCISRGFPVVITGTPDETIVAKEVLKFMKNNAINITGATSLGAVALLIKNAFALITNCTGVSHIAAAMETPSIVISMDGEPERWSPLNKELHYVIDWKENPDFKEVFDQMERLLKKTKVKKLHKAV